jgi:hypothetical protein
MKVNNIRIGLVDADLLDGGTRHPNLALLKIAGFLHDNKIPFELIEDEEIVIGDYTKIYVSKVFTFTHEPKFLLEARENNTLENIAWGGTGYYGEDDPQDVFIKLREEDMTKLEKDEFLLQFPNHRGGVKMGIDMAHQMPYYDLYKSYIDKKIAAGRNPTYFKDYMNYSIGFLTRGCFRKCPFCVNRLERRVLPYSELDWFLDNEKDENGKHLRPNIYLWDDNFLAADPNVWRTCLQQLIDTGRPFQFRQGLDERMLAESPYGEEMAEMLSHVRYHGDFIFAFDNWKDRSKIEKALKIWKHFNPKKGTKFYLFCGFKQNKDNREKFYKDIWEIFQRVKVLMTYGCVGYIMRHEDYHNAPIPNLYIQIARWCNQQQFYKKMSFWEFCYRNQSYWEDHQKNHDFNRPQLMPFESFMRDVEAGVYGGREGQIKMCLPLKTILNVINMFPDHKQELVEMFNYKMDSLINPHLWEVKE